MPITWDDEKPSGIKWDDEVTKKATNSNPTIGEFIFGDATGKEYLKGRLGAVKSALDPETYRNLASEITKPLPAISREDINPKEGSSIFGTPEIREKSISLVASMLPVTQMSTPVREGIVKPSLSAAESARQAALQNAAKAGYSVPRSNIEQTTLTNLGERFGGKQAIEATAQMKNQPVTNRLAAKALGLADDVSVTPELLQGIRSEAGKAYEAVKNVGTLSSDDVYRAGLRKIKLEMAGASKDFPELASSEVAKLADALNKKTISAEGAVEMVKNLRGASKANYGPTASAQDKLLSKAQRKAADLLDDLIERNIEPSLGKEMLDTYRKARQLIAKTYTVENSLVGENVSAQKLAKLATKAPLSGELKQISDFATSFPRLSRVELGAPPSGGLLEPLIYGGLGGAATGGPGAVAAAVPIIGKPIARHLMTTVPKITGNYRLDNALAQRAILGTGIALDEQNALR